MLRPQSIVRFDRIYLAQLVVGAIYSFASFASNRAAMMADPAMARVGVNTFILLGAMALGLAISLLLWFGVARRASNLAKWVLVVLTVLGAAMLPFSLASAPLGILESVATLALTLAQLVAIAFLFRKDARDWLASGGRIGPTDPAVFG